jgi:four helix bundle protein
MRMNAGNSRHPASFSIILFVQRLEYMHRSAEYRSFAEAMRKRTRSFALDVIRLCRQFPKTIDGYVVAKQLIKSSTSTAANYRAACRSRTPDDFANRIAVVCEEADESEFWLDLTLAAPLVSSDDAVRLHAEAYELTAIFTKSRETSKQNQALRRQRQRR